MLFIPFNLRLVFFREEMATAPQPPPKQESQCNHDADAEDEYSDSEDDWLAPPKTNLVEGDEGHRVKDIDLNALDGDERELAGAIVLIEFSLPNGEKVERKYPMGQTIGYIKGQLEDLYGFPYHAITLKMNGKVLIDPLSLNDLPFDTNSSNGVQVIVAG